MEAPPSNSPRTRKKPHSELLSALAGASMAFALGSCGGDRSNSTSVAPAPPAAAAPAALTGATGPQAPPPTPQPIPPPAAGRSDRSCFAPLEGPGSRVTLRPAHGQLVLGVVSGLKDASDENLAHLRNLAAELRRRGAEILIAAGDLGDNSDAQSDLLSALASVELPLLVLPGNREVRSDLDAAEAALHKRAAQLVDLSHIRVVDLGDALVVGMPGVFDKRLLRADGACLYAQTDLDALAAFLDKQSPNAPPALMVAAVPPHGDGLQALDVSDGQNVGEMRFIPLLISTRARFGVFGQVWESGGRGVDGQGRAVAPAQFANQLYVNPGAADATPWPMNDGTTSKGLAALFIIRARQASYEVIREPVSTPRSP